MSIEAMKLALEALQRCEGRSKADEGDRHRAITSLRQAIEQAEKQEPVCDTDPRGCWSVRCQLGNKCKNTPAPQREWVGLTDEDIEDACPVEVNRNEINFARAIEAKLREKNA